MNGSRRVVSASRTLVADWTGRSTRLAVRGHHASVVNLVTESGDIISLAVNPQDRGPFHLQGTPELLQDPPVFLAWPQIQGRTWTEDCRQIPQWQDRLPQGNPCPRAGGSQLHSMLDQLLATASPASLLPLEYRALKARTDSLQQALAVPSDQLPDALAHAATGLLGLGSGLTPAGDDVLMGALFMLQRLAPQSAFWTDRYVQLQACLLAVPCQRTARISGQWLCQAAQGNWNALWHGLWAALDAQDADRIRQALAALAQLGHTSGYCALAGMRAVLAVTSRSSPSLDAGPGPPMASPGMADRHGRSCPATVRGPW